MDAKTNLKSRLPSRHATEGARASAAPSVLLCDGFEQRGDPSALCRRRDLLERSRPMQHRADAASPGGEAGRCRGRRYAARVLYHHGYRRHRHGARRHEGLAAFARSDSQLHRADHPRPLVRRDRRCRRLRQVPARHDDGNVPAQRAVDLYLRRLDPARHLQGSAGYHSGRLRGGRQTFGRRHVGRRSGDARAECLSLGRCLRRAIYRQHHGDRVRSDWACAALFGRSARAVRDAATNSACWRAR